MPTSVAPSRLEFDRNDAGTRIDAEGFAGWHSVTCCARIARRPSHDRRKALRTAAVKNLIRMSWSSPSAPEHECGLAATSSRRDRLHLVFREIVRVQHHDRGIAAEALAGECVDLK